MGSVPDTNIHVNGLTL